MDYKIERDNTISVSKYGRLKKITGTRLASILGLNNWNTPFQTWCDMTKVYSPPFEDTIYTIAGKVIEPKIIEYLKKKMTMGEVIDGEEYWGKDFAKMRFDYYPENPLFGGMWDALILSKKTRKPMGVIEIKTTKRAEDWRTDIPLYYKIQAMLYARLLKVKTIYFAVAFLTDDIYDDPNSFVASDDTVKIISFRLDNEEIDDYISRATKWYDIHIIGKRSPEWNEKADSEVLKVLRTNTLDVEESVEIETLLKIIDELKPRIDSLKRDEATLKKTQEAIKAYLMTKFGETDTRVSVESGLYEITLTKTKSDKPVFDEERYKEDYPTIYEKYLIKEVKENIRQSVTLKKTKEEN